MPLFTKESLENLRQRIDLVEVLSGHLELKRSGASYKTHCPFHDEKTPSFMIQKGDSHYHCFGCGVHGDAIHFLMTHLKMSFLEAVESLAQRFHVHLETVEGSEENKGPNKAVLRQALDAAMHFFHFLLLNTPEGHEALQYLYARGIDLEFVKQFQIGFAPKSPGMFRTYMHAKGFYDDNLIAAGLLAEREDSRTPRDFFVNRITFPIHHPSGYVIGFSARKFHEETFGGKYVNTPETPLFKKSKVLFGLNHSRKRIAKERRCIVVEGQIDALRLIQAGFNITVAGQGTAFGEGHAKELMALGVQTVYLALDPDLAGQEAAKKVGNIFQKEGVEVFVLQLPMGKDPDAFLRENGTEAFSELMQKGVSYLEFLVKNESRQFRMDSPAGKNALVNKIAEQIREWNSELLVHESLRKLAHLAQVPEHFVANQQPYHQHIFVQRSDRLGLGTVDVEKVLESDLLRWLLIMGESQPLFIDCAKMNLKVEDLRIPVCRALFKTFMDLKEKGEKCSLLTLAIQADTGEGQEFLSNLLEKKINKDRAVAHFCETIQRILDRNWMEQREQVRLKIQSGNCSDEEALQLARDFDRLKSNQPRVNVPDGLNNL